MSLTAGKQLLLTSASGAYQISRSLRFNSGDSAYLNRTPASAGNRTIYTFSGWVKRAALTTRQVIFSATNGADADWLYFHEDNTLRFIQEDGLSSSLTTTQVFRDSSAWYHILLAVDTTQGTSSNRVKLYVNGQQITTFSTASYPSSSYAGGINNTVAHNIGRRTTGADNYLSAYLAECYLLDGTAATPESFTTTDSNGELQPKTYTGTYGTNGFKLSFSDNSTTAALGTDTSGNGNTWTVNNFSVLSNNYAYAPVTSTNAATTAPLINMFDGSLSTYWQIYSSGVYDATATFSPAIVGGTLVEIYANKNNPGGAAVVIEVNNTNITGLLTGGADWYDISSVASGGISSIKLYRQDGVMNPLIYAIRINGTVIITNPAGNDSLVDTPTSYGTDTGVGNEVRGNYATLNNLLNTTGSYANGNLERTSSDNTGALGTICPSSGKWYAEFTWTTIGSTAVGVIISTRITASAADGLTQSWQLGYISTGKLETAGSQSNVTGFTTSDVIGVAFDSATGAATFYKNGSSIGTATSAAFASVPVGIGACGGGSAGTNTFIANFGQRAFAYTAPSGFKALVDTNLPTPVVAKGSSAMDVKLYTGNGSTQTISGLNFSPDFVWIKTRSASGYAHILQDTVRGAGKSLATQNTNAEVGNTGDFIGSFNSDGFSVNTTYLGGTAPETNGNGDTFVGWAWDAGTSTVTNTAGSITSQVRANPSTGFSVVGFNSGSAGNYTVGHGLGVKPQFIITKARNGSTFNWSINHVSIATTVNKYLTFTTSATSDNGSAAWGASLADTNSTTFGISSANAVEASKDCIAYCFAPVSGYSSFGSYTGNGSSDGPFVFTGMRPRWVLFKCSSTTSAWNLTDTARQTYNVQQTWLQPNTSDAEYTGGSSEMDILSNGFKLRNSNSPFNTNGATYIWAAFAESPFQYARAR
jgi:hypothetical protein